MKKKNLMMQIITNDFNNDFLKQSVPSSTCMNEKKIEEKKIFYE